MSHDMYCPPFTQQLYVHVNVCIDPLFPQLLDYLLFCICRDSIGYEMCCLHFELIENICKGKY